MVWTGYGDASNGAQRVTVNTVRGHFVAPVTSTVDNGDVNGHDANDNGDNHNHNHIEEVLNDNDEHLGVPVIACRLQQPANRQ